MAPNEGMNLLQARYLFHTREQLPTESVDEFVRDLSKLSANCSYDASPRLLQSLVRDRFIVGLRSKEVQSKLLSKNEDISLDLAVEFVKSSDGARNIKQEDEDEVMTSVYDKLQVQMNEVDVEVAAAADVKVTEEARIAILIELMNHKSVLMAPSGHEGEKAVLWERVFKFATSVGAPFKSALHLREVFATWKQSALQARQQNSQEDVKMSNADKLICDLLSSDDYPNLASNMNPMVQENNYSYSDNDNDNEEEYNFDEADLNSSESTDNDDPEYESEEEFRPLAAVKRRRGRPRKESPTRGSSTAMAPEVKILILKRLVNYKDIIGPHGSEKDKKGVWKSVYGSLKSKLKVGSPSVLRGAFRVWKQRSMKKLESPGEVAGEADQLIYQIFDAEVAKLKNTQEASQDLESSFDNDSSAKEVKEEAKEDASKEPPEDVACMIDHSLRISVLQEMARNRRVLILNLGNVYEKETAWREVHAKLTAGIGSNCLSMAKMKELINFWQARAFHDSINQGGPATTLQKLIYHIYNVDKNAAVPFAEFKNGTPPPLISRVSGCVHFSSAAKVAILKELLKCKNESDKSLAWEKVIRVAQDHNVCNVNKQRIKYVLKQWRKRALRLAQESKGPVTKAERLVFELFDIHDNYLKQDSDSESSGDDELESFQESLNVSEEAKMALATLLEANPQVLCRSTPESVQRQFWSMALEEMKEVEPGIEINVQRAFWKWCRSNHTRSEKMFRQLVTLVQNISKVQVNDDLKLGLVAEICNHHQEVFLLGSREELHSLYSKDLLSFCAKFGVHLSHGAEVGMLLSLWKDEVKSSIKSRQQLRPHEQMLLDLVLGHQDPKLNLDSVAQIVPLVRKLQGLDPKCSRRAAWTQIQQKCNLLEPLSLFKAVNCWKLVTLKKKEFGHELSEEEAFLLEHVTCQDHSHAELLVLSQDSSRYDHEHEVFMPDAAKQQLTSMVSAKHELVFSTSNQSLNFWSEALEALARDGHLVVVKKSQMQQMFFAWILEAWNKRMHNAGYLSGHEQMLLDLAVLKKTSMAVEAGDFEDFEPSSADLELNEKVFITIIQELAKFKQLAVNDKSLFWTLALKLAQGLWPSLNVDQASHFYAAFLSRKQKVQQKLLRNVPLLNEERCLMALFGIEVAVDEAEDDGDDVYEVENFWDSLRDDISDRARMAILDILHAHKDIVAKTRFGGDHDRVAVWQKALNVAIEQGLKVENHSRLMKVVRDWRERAIKNEIDGLPIAHWERYLLNIFREDIKEEPSEMESDQTPAIPEPLKSVIGKTMLRHKHLILSDDQDSSGPGWRKVFRVAQANGAFFDNLSVMQSAIEAWKSKVVCKLSNDPRALSEADKYIFSIYEIHTGDLDLDQVGGQSHQEHAAVKTEAPLLSLDAKVAILEEMLRNKADLANAYSSHKDKFYAWANVLSVANAVGGSFESIAQLSDFIINQLRPRTLEKISLPDAKSNEVDALLAKIYELDISRLQFEAEVSQSTDSSFTCRPCQLQYSRYDELRVHQQMLHGHVEEAFEGKCRVCGLDIGVSKAAVRAHLRSRHPLESFSCDFCDAGFADDADYHGHVRSHIPYNPLETLERVSSEQVLDAPKSKKRGVYRKRVKLEIPMPDSDELPKIGRKEGGLCPHCGEVITIIRN